MGDFPLGPALCTPAGSRAGAAPLYAAVASRAAPAIELHDLRALWAARAGPLPAPLWRLPLESRPRVLAAGDLGADGRVEVLVITLDGDLIVAAQGREVSRQRLGRPQATCARVSRDGRFVWVGFQGTRELVRLRHEGRTGTELIEDASVALPGLPRAIAELRAGGSSLVCVAGGEDALWMFDSEPDGGLRPTRRGPGGGVLQASSVPIALAQGDLDRDGAEDLVSIALHGQEARVHLACAGAPTASLYAGQHPWAAALGDFDGDGQLDLAVSNRDAKRISLLFGARGGQLLAAPAAPTGGAPNRLASGDLDGDGRPDLVVLNALDGSLSVLRNLPGGLGPNEPQLNAGSATALQLADLDGDGLLDALWLVKTDHGCRLEAAFGDGQGRLRKRAQVPPRDAGRSAGDLLTADLDGDGVPEAVVSDPEGAQVLLVPIERDAAGAVRLGEPRALEVHSGPVALALLHAPDGALEIAVALSGPGERLGVALLRAAHDASGTLTLIAAGHALPGAAVTALAAADLDGDGRTDLALLLREADGPGSVATLLRDASGGWTAGPRTPTGLRPFALCAADLDGDGRADLLVSAQNSHHVNLWLSRPGERLSLVRMPDLGAGTGCLGLLLADLDGDGRVELLVANAFSNDVSWIRFD